jgi:hypothetical protein
MTRTAAINKQVLKIRLTQAKAIEPITASKPAKATMNFNDLLMSQLTQSIAPANPPPKNNFSVDNYHA